MFQGMRLPQLQVGDTIRAGMAVAQIPDLHNWEMTARIGELDRGHLVIGQPAELSIIAAPGKKLVGHVKDLGSVAGPPWDRHFDCKIAIDQPIPELRPGMSAVIVITTEALKNVAVGSGPRRYSKAMGARSCTRKNRKGFCRRM